jgi:hypothetical protein
VEKEGLQFVAENLGKNYYGEEKLGDTTYYTAVYADMAVAPACVDCHNDHKDSPRNDFKIGEVMGGVVIRIPLSKSSSDLRGRRFSQGPASQRRVISTIRSML